MAAGGIKAGRAYIELGIDDAGALKKLNSFRRRFTSIGRSLRNIGTIATGLGVSLAAPLVASVKAASDYQETLSKFNTVYGELAAGQKAWIDDFAKQVGRGKAELTGFAAGFQDLLVPIGIDEQAAAAASRTLTKLAIDLGSFNNLNPADVARDLSAALTGSSETMKKYGVIVNEAAVKQQLLNQGLDPNKVSEAQKAQARLAIFLRDTTKAQGDALRTASGFANQMQALRAQIGDLAIEIGGAFVPSLERVNAAVLKAIPLASEWVKENQAVIVVVGALSATLVTLGVAALTASGIFAGLSAVMAGLPIMVTAISAGVAALNPAVIALGAAVAGVTIAFLAFDKSGNLASNTIDRMIASMKDFTGLTVDNSSAESIRLIAIESELAAARTETAFSKMADAIQNAAYDTSKSFAIFLPEDAAKDFVASIDDEARDRSENRQATIERLLAERKSLKTKIHNDVARAEQDRLNPDPVALEVVPVVPDPPGPPEEKKNDGISSAVSAIQGIFGRNEKVFTGLELARNLKDSAVFAAKRIRDAQNFQDIEPPEISLADGRAREVSENLNRAFEDSSKRAEDKQQKLIKVNEDILSETRKLSERLFNSAKSFVFQGG